MFITYLKIAWRNLLRNKVNSFINIGGLALGIASVVFIASYIQDETSFDKCFANGDQIYEVNLDGNFGGQQYNTAFTPPPVAIDLHNTFPEVEAYTRIYRPGNCVLHNENNTRAFTEKRIWAVDSSFLQVFSYPLLAGNAAACLSQPHSIVLTETMAHKYFGDQPALGKTLLIDTNSSPLLVTGILKDLPNNVSLQFDGLTSIRDNRLVNHFSWSWIWGQLTAYVVLNKKTAASPAAIMQLQSRFPAMVRRDAAKAFARIGQNYDDFIRKGGKWDFYLQPLTAIHLNSSQIGTPIENLSDMEYIYIFSILAVFIILLACINFMNIATARAMQRAKEVGIRKVMGSLRSQMTRQFLFEALLYTCLAGVLALALIYAFMGPFNGITEKHLGFADLFRGYRWVLFLALLLFAGLLSGSYPAFYLTSFQPIEVLKGSTGASRNTGNRLIRNGLVVFQFTVSITLIIATLVVYRQLQYIRTKDLGFNKENVLILPNLEKLGGKEETIRQQLSRINGIHYVSVTSGMPANSNSIFEDFYQPVTTDVKESLAKDLTLASYLVDEYYVPAMQLQIVKGRNFSKEYADSASVIVNEKAVQQAGWKDAIGKQIRYPGNDDQTFTIVGVVKDFNTRSLKSEVSPWALFYTSSKTFRPMSNYLVASTDSRHTTEVLQTAADVWKKLAPGIPFEYSFLDKNYEALYRSEEKMGSVFGLFTGLSLVVACLGLFGLSVYTAEKRNKEIGIRKILGASVPSVVGLLSREYLQLIGLSALIAFPLAAWGMTRWLENFAYRTALDPSVFLFAAFLALGIAMATISIQALRAATANPTKSLRAE